MSLDAHTRTHTLFGCRFVSIPFRFELSKSSPKRNLMCFIRNLIYSAQVRVQETKVKSCRTNKKVVKLYNNERILCFTFSKDFCPTLWLDFVYLSVYMKRNYSSQIECECLLLSTKKTASERAGERKRRKSNQ